MEDADVAAVVAQTVFCTVAITMENVGQTPLFPRRLINSVRSSFTWDERGTILPTPSFPLTSNFHFRQHELLFLLISTTPSFFPSFESKPRWFRPPLSILFHWSVSPSVTRGCCCHRTTFAFPVVRRRRSVKVLEVVARSNNHEQPELSFERASERARQLRLRELTSLLPRPLAVN